MANTNDIKRRLNQYRKKVVESEIIRKEIEYAKERYGEVKSVSFDGMPSGKGGDNGGPTERQVLRKIALEEKLKERETELEADWRLIEPLLEILSPTECLLIRLRYYYAIDWDAVCERLYGKKPDYTEEQESYKNRMFLMHGRALSALARRAEKNSKI